MPSLAQSGNSLKKIHIGSVVLSIKEPRGIFGETQYIWTLADYFTMSVSSE